MTFRVHYQNNGELFILFIEANFSMQAVFSSPKPKGQVSFLIEIWPLSVLVVVVIVVVIKTFHIIISGPISTKHGTKHSGRWLRNSENTLAILRIFFLKTTGPISTKLCRKHHWVKGIQVYSNEGPHPFSRGDKNTVTKFRNLLKNHRAIFNQTCHKAS